MTAPLKTPKGKGKPPAPPNRLIRAATEFGHWLVDLTLRAILAASRALPYPQRIAALSRLTRYVIGPVAGWPARARTHLAMIWPDMDPAERHAIAARSVANIGRSFAENYAPDALRAEVEGTEFTGPGAATLLTELAAGNRVILASAHFGSFEAPRAALGAAGFPIAMIYRRADNRFFQQHYAQTLRQISGPVFFKGKRGTSAFMEHIAAGHPGMLLTDVYVADGEMIDFLGKPAPTATTAAWLALKHDAPLIPVYGIRQPDGISFELVAEAPIPHSDPVTMTAALNDSLAARIREHPDQWLWSHRRWKAPRRKPKHRAKQT